MINVIPVSALVIGAVFAASAASKLRAPRAFVEGVIDFDVLPLRFAWPSAVVLMLVEFLVAWAHLTGAGLEIAAPVTLMLLGGFAVVIQLNLRRGRAIRCHCFGGSSLISRVALVRLALLGTASFIVAVGTFGSIEWTGLWHVENVSWACMVMLIGSWLLASADLVEVLSRCSTCTRGPGVAAVAVDAREMGHG